MRRAALDTAAAAEKEATVAVLVQQSVNKVMASTSFRFAVLQENHVQIYLRGSLHKLMDKRHEFWAFEVGKISLNLPKISLPRKFKLTARKRSKVQNEL